jgi:hypothetical protein
LSKKPEGVTEDGEFPAPPAPVTSKPEVFFVKYKTQQEAEGAISNIQGTFGAATSNHLAQSLFLSV